MATQIDLSKGVPFVSRTGRIRTPRYLITVAVEQRVAKKRGWHALGPRAAKGPGSVGLNDLNQQLYEQIIQGKKAPGVRVLTVLKTHLVRADGRHVSAWIELLAETYQLVVKNRGKAARLPDNTTIKFLADKHDRQGFAAAILMCARYGVRDATVKRIFDAAVMGNHIDKVMLYASVSGWYSGRRNLTIRKSRKHWEDGI